jgi:hypothetical protein
MPPADMRRLDTPVAFMLPDLGAVTVLDLAAVTVEDTEAATAVDRFMTAATATVMVTALAMATAPMVDAVAMVFPLSVV